MKQNKLSEKSTKTLLNILDAAYSGQIKSDPDYLNHVLKELNKRNLTPDEKKKFDELMLFYVNEIPESFTENNEESNPMINDIFFDSNHETEFDNKNDKFLALKTFASIISIIGYFIIFIGVIGFLYSLSADDGLFADYGGLLGFINLIISVVTALVLLAFSNLIYVQIDTEANTRKTYKLLNKILNKK
jgi:hypothetical protein